jgi:hypothetical protein
MLPVLIYVVRRILILTLVFKLSNFSGLQIMFYQFLNLLCAIYYIYVKPHDSRLKNRIEMMNETFILIIGSHVFLFTNFVPDLAIQETIGKSVIFFICLNTALNLIPMLRYLANSIFLFIKKHYNLFCDRFGFDERVIQEVPKYTPE